MPELGALSDDELRELIETLTAEERDISYRRRLLHGRIDIMRAELLTRERRRGEAARGGSPPQPASPPESDSGGAPPAEG